ncbi:BTAD domain-containing putative transcriptional regulator [Streptomyces mirabilis]|uniref:AfsR/SARP family transcriptional regulator n=1 Tax=Streptomyces mirabilis TaxID=68239 RepID=UPI0036BE3709
MTDRGPRRPSGERRPPVALGLLGHFRLEYGTTAVPVGTGGRRLLALLGLRQRAPRSVLAGTLWPDTTEERALGSLRTTLWKLRGQHPSVVRCVGEDIALAEAVAVDVRVLTESALRTVRPVRHAVTGAPDDPDLPLLDALLGGDLLPGWDEDWVLPERERLRQLRLHALEALSERLVAEGRHALALEAALASVRVEPLRESAHRAVVAVHLAEHNLGEAVRHYEAFRGLLRAELGVEPSGRFGAMLGHARAPYPAVTGDHRLAGVPPTA